MARLLPIDLVNASFSKASFGGYKPEEVNVLVDRAAQALEEANAENEDLRLGNFRDGIELILHERFDGLAHLEVDEGADDVEGDVLRAGQFDGHENLSEMGRWWWVCLIRRCRGRG